MVILFYIILEPNNHLSSYKKTGKNLITMKKEITTTKDTIVVIQGSIPLDLGSNNKINSPLIASKRNQPVFRF